MLTLLDGCVDVVVDMVGPELPQKSEAELDVRVVFVFVFFFVFVFVVSDRLHARGILPRRLQTSA